MGRHSAPADDEDDVAVDLADASSDVEDDSAVTGRHLRIQDLPSALTQAIPIVDAEIAADADAHIAPVLDTPAAEFEPILPGEAVIPPEATDDAGGLDALDALLGSGDPRPEPHPRPARAETISEPAAVESEPVESEPVESEPVESEPVESEPVESEPVESEPVESEPVAVPEPAVPAEPAKPRPSPRRTKAEKDAARNEAREARQAARESRAAEPRVTHEHASAADLALLRSDRTLLSRVLAGLLVPFVVYAIVMLIVGGHGAQWLLWIWIPTITGCVVAGGLLDLAHKQAAALTETPQAQTPQAETAPADLSGS